MKNSLTLPGGIVRFRNFRHTGPPGGAFILGANMEKVCYRTTPTGNRIRVLLKNYLIDKSMGTLSNIQEMGTKNWRKRSLLIFKSFKNPPKKIAHAY